MQLLTTSNAIFDKSSYSFGQISCQFKKIYLYFLINQHVASVQSKGIFEKSTEHLFSRVPQERDGLQMLTCTLNVLCSSLFDCLLSSVQYVLLSANWLIELIPCTIAVLGLIPGTGTCPIYCLLIYRQVCFSAS